MTRNVHDSPAPTQEDVARASGFSRTLVSRALRGAPRVSEAARRRILAVAEELGYRPNEMASRLASSSSTVVGMVLPDARNPFYDQLCEELGREFEAVGQTLMVTFSGPNPADALRQVDRFLRLRVTGLILVSPSLDPDEIGRLGEQTPVCLIGHRPVGGRVDAVRLDEQAAARVVVDHLAEAGMSRVVHVAPPEHLLDPTGQERRDALAAAARSRALQWGTRDSGGDAGGQVREALAEWSTPLAVVVHNDVLGLDAVAAARAAGRTVGRDVAIVSYDNTFLAQRPEFDLSSVDQSPAALAAAAVSLLMERATVGADAARTIVLAPRLIVRSSSRPGSPADLRAGSPPPAGWRH